MKSLARCRIGRSVFDQSIALGKADETPRRMSGEKVGSNTTLYDKRTSTARENAETETQGAMPRGKKRMPRKYFKLNISADAYLAYYRGSSQSIVTQSEDGHRIQFPANELRKFVSHAGIHGRFEITYSRDNKLLDIRKMSS